MKLNINKIEALRNERKLTRDDVAKILGMSYDGYYAMLERRSTSLKTMSRLAKVLRCEISDILSGK